MTVEANLNEGSTVQRGQKLGVVNNPGVGNGNFAHIHMEGFTGSGCTGKVPFSGSRRFECVQNLPNSGVQGQWGGLQLRRCEDDVATFYNYGSGEARIHVWLSTGTSLAYQGANGWWSVDSGYPLFNVGNRFLAGDWDSSGDEDLTTFYDYGSGAARIHVWLSSGSGLSYTGIGGSHGSNGWWQTASGYSLSQVAGRFEPGDFDADGDDDLTTFYDYGSGAARIHVWLSTGSAFSYQGADPGWYKTTSGYPLVNVSERFTSGDFDGDGDDDVATFYDYGSGLARIHVWLSTGSAFSYQGANPGWWETPPGGSYTLAAVGSRFVSGDFNGDGRDDIATMYDYAGSLVRIHVWLSTGSAFTYQGDLGWYSQTSGYDIGSVGAHFRVADLNADGKADITTLYDVNGSAARIDAFLSTGTSFRPPAAWWSTSSGYSINNVAGRFASGGVSGQ
jgi:hypothetical protein